MEAGLILTILGAFGFRIRGDEIVSQILGRPSSFVGRLIWGLSLGVPAAIIGGYTYLLLVPLLLLGAIPGWYGSIDLGRNENSFERDVYVMALRGLVFTLPAGLVLYFLGKVSLLFALGGLACPVWYCIGWLIPIQNRWVGNGTPLSEALFGAFVGLTLYLSMGNV